ncbi:MAG: FtsX-like permease family protein, partial [Longimicrobiales bacterium]
RIWSVDDELAITSVMPRTERMRDSLAEQRYRMRLMITFAALAGCFALLGIHGVTSRSVARRTHEVGIRMALGSSRRRVLSLVLGEGLRLVVIGAGIGLIGSFLATRVIERFLYAAGRNDPLVLTAVILGLGLLGLIASLGPARRAVRVDPIVALRADLR